MDFFRITGLFFVLAIILGGMAVGGYIFQDVLVNDGITPEEGAGVAAIALILLFCAWMCLKSIVEEFRHPPKTGVSDESRRIILQQRELEELRKKRKAAASKTP